MNRLETIESKAHGGRKKNGKQAIVVGGSLAGLLATRVLSDHFEQVTLIEHDKIHDQPESRKGQPQTCHVHALLANGLDLLTRYFPDLPDALHAGGGILGDMGMAMRWHSFGGYRLQFESNFIWALVSRPFLEWQIRRCVVARSNVNVVDQCKVVGLVTTSDSSRVTGVRTIHRAENNRDATLPADLVIDTTGRGTSAIRWLEALGYTGPSESMVKIDVTYTSRIYRRNPGDLVGADMVIVTPDPPRHKRLGVILPMEDDRWNVTLVGWAGDHAPANGVGFLEYAGSLPVPDVYDMITRLEPLTDIFTHKIPSSLRRHYEKLTRFPEGFLVMGDAISSFNPVYAQGMTSAAMQAVALDELLTEFGPLKSLWKVYFKRAAKIVAIPWQLTVGEDFRFPETQGKKAFGTDLINAYVAKVHRATHGDPVVYGAFLKVMNLMAPPASLFHPHILWRVLCGGRKAM